MECNKDGWMDGWMTLIFYLVLLLVNQNGGTSFDILAT
jgi:hypothetical protein